MTSFVLVAAMDVQFVVAVESFSAEPTFRVTSEARLIDCAWIVVTISFVTTEEGRGEELVFVGEDLLVSSAEVAVER
jgi:hypothetical protein